MLKLARPAPQQHRNRRTSKVGRNVLRCIYAHCREKNIGLSAFMRTVDVSYSALKRLETGQQQDLYGQSLWNIADEIGISVDELIGRR